MLSCVTKKKNPKGFPCSSFACWELSHVNSFSRFCFSLFICLFKKNQKLQKCFSVFPWNSFFLLSHTKEKTTMKVLSGSLMNYCWSKEEPKLPCLLLLNKMFADSSLVHGTLALLLFSYRSVVQVKGNNDDIRWTGRDKEKRVWTRLVLFL